MTYNYGDIVQTTHIYGLRQYVVLKVFEGKYQCVSLQTSRRYTLVESQIEKKVGTAPSNSPLLIEHIYDAKKGAAYALYMAGQDKANKDRWNKLASFQPGQAIEVAHRKTIYPAVFVGVNLKKPKLVFRANFTGKDYDLPIESVVAGFTTEQNRGKVVQDDKGESNDAG